jgi:hypothetical protein
LGSQETLSKSIMGIIKLFLQERHFKYDRPVAPVADLHLPAETGLLACPSHNAQAYRVTLSCHAERIFQLFPPLEDCKTVDDSP